MRIPLPHIIDSLDALSGSSWFSTLDLVSGYWQCEMHDDDKEKTAFSTHKGLYQFKVLPFGLCNAPATFERLMELILRGLLWERCLCYLDDVIVFGTSFENAMENLRIVVSRFRDANLKLKPSKCLLFQTEVLFLGHIVSKKGIQCDPKKVECVQNWPQPSNVTEVRSFLGMAGYYRRFIPSFSSIAKPLTHLTRKRSKFVWDEACQLAFDLVWFGFLRIYVDLAIFQPYLDLEAGDNQSLKIRVARPGIEPRSSCSASQELNHSATAAPS